MYNIIEPIKPQTDPLESSNSPMAAAVSPSVTSDVVSSTGWSIGDDMTLPSSPEMDQPIQG